MDGVIDLPCFAECLELLTAQDLIRSARSSKSWCAEVWSVLERRHKRLGLCAIGGLLEDHDPKFASNSLSDDYVFALRRTLAQLAWLPQALVLFCTEASDAADLCADSALDRISFEVKLPSGCKTIVATCDGVVGPDLFTGQAREVYDETDDLQGISFLLLRSAPDRPPPALLRCHKSQAEGSPASRSSWGKRRKQQIQRWIQELGRQPLADSSPSQSSEAARAAAPAPVLPPGPQLKCTAGPCPGSLHLLLVCDEDRGEWAEHCMSALNDRKNTHLEDHRVVGGYVSGLSSSFGQSRRVHLPPADMVLLTIFGGGLSSGIDGDGSHVSGHRDCFTALGWAAAEPVAAAAMNVGRGASVGQAIPESAPMRTSSSSSTACVGSRAVVMDEDVAVGAQYLAGAAEVLTAAGVDGAAPIAAAATLAAAKSAADSAAASENADASSPSAALAPAVDSPLPPPPRRRSSRQLYSYPDRELQPILPPLPPPNFEPKFGFVMSCTARGYEYHGDIANVEAEAHATLLGHRPGHSSNRGRSSVPVGFPLVGGFVNGEIGPGRGGAGRVGTHGYSTVLGLFGNDRTRTPTAPTCETIPRAAASSAEDDRNFEFNFDPAADPAN